MPCTRSMRSQSKPKPSGSKKDPDPTDTEDEMPPPPAKTKTRSTKSKKTSKASNVQEMEVEVPPPESPVPSTTSQTARATRSKARTKPQSKTAAPPPRSVTPPPPQPKQKVTRTTKKQTNSSQSSKSGETDVSDVDQEDSSPPPATVTKPKSKTVNATAKKRTRGRPKKNVAAATASEPASEDLSTADDDMEDMPRKIKTLTLEQLDKCHATPIRTAFEMGVCDAFPNFMDKVMDPEAILRQERAFQELMNSTEMPPPPPPAAKTRGRPRVKRVRSPEPTPKKTVLPKSFDFADKLPDTLAPAKKKMILDMPAPEAESAPEVDSVANNDLDGEAEAESRGVETSDSEAGFEKADAEAIAGLKEKKKLKGKKKETGPGKEKKKLRTREKETKTTDEENLTEDSPGAGAGDQMMEDDTTQKQVAEPEKVSKKEEKMEEEVPKKKKKLAEEGEDKKEKTEKKKKLTEKEKTTKKGKTKRQHDKVEEGELATTAPEPEPSSDKINKPLVERKVSEPAKPSKSSSPSSTEKKEKRSLLFPEKNVDASKSKISLQKIAPAPPAKITHDIFEESVIEIPFENDNVTTPIAKPPKLAIPTTTPKHSDTTENTQSSNQSPVTVIEASSNAKSAVVEQKKSTPLPLDRTFVLETPKDSKKTKLSPNAEFTPELFGRDTPKANPTSNDTPKTSVVGLGNQTITISKGENRKTDDDMENANDHPVVPSSKEKADDDATPTSNSASGIVSSLVNFFSKSKTDKANSVNVATSSEVATTSRSPLPEDKAIAGSDSKEKSPIDMNSTYVLPSTKDQQKQKTPALLNVTVCLKKIDQDEIVKPKPVPIFPPTSNPFVGNNSAASRTFVKESPGLDIVVEEDDEVAASVAKAGKKVKPGTSKHASKDKESKKGTSSSSSSSSSSLKSASSQPCLLGSSKKALGSSKGSTYGSTGKLHEVHKSRPLEEAEKRKKELIQQKIENQKKKLEEWRKKTEKNKLEQERKQKEKEKLVLPSSSSGILKKPAPILGAPSAPTFIKPKFNFGPSSGMLAKGAGSFVPPLSKQPFHKPKPPPSASSDGDLDESYKTAASNNSFLDSTIDRDLSSYDITVYEELDEDLKHRENKTIPNWASNKEALNSALFSMLYFTEYQSRLNIFPKPDRTYKLFPPRMQR